MLSAALTRALTMPAFTAGDFTPTKWDSAKDKADFANALLRFIADDFPETKFHKAFYNRLSMTFGHIAHYDRNGFYGHFFLTTKDKIAFLKQCLNWRCFGDPTYTYCDVERAVSERLRNTNIVALLQSQTAVEQRQSDLALLAKLKARYEAAPLPSEPAPSLFSALEGAQ